MIGPAATALLFGQARIVLLKEISSCD